MKFRRQHSETKELAQEALEKAQDARKAAEANEKEHEESLIDLDSDLGQKRRDLKTIENEIR